MRMQIGAVNYLNSKPLVYQLAAENPQSEVLYDLPSRLADSLAAGRLDVALVPSVEFLSNPAYQLASDACVASAGPVRSVKLYFRRPPALVRQIALDEGSRTSAALAQVLLARRFEVRPERVSLPIGSGAGATDADAVLLIGDRAMLAPEESFVEEWDLASEWRKWSDLPFVFACWSARPGVDISAISVALAAARDSGMQHLREIANDQASKIGVTADLAYEYLTTNLHYQIGPRERESLELFARECRQLRLFSPSDALPT